ncbi:uncharacterized protein AKAW2_50691A [Aspergillus luchuensis]|uniref:Uncharacterized protein n=5 Tax=Aspergillus subgen. Circumdati TaxID=2720871 RepID=A0A8G1QR69_9EURO|nr:hypothetical protein BO87DRAFT_367204 [Aspergillus neoniger CBS 115656]XP_025510041.1 hypothetical protein BO85DRAFT_454322 [Aspergillus piperis CBS 112811]XP_025539410.1 hypothetical protein BO79DRAFT_287623 [Aspergillus costaricaensis CBS 115574]XP_041544112.1 uncharacterized protein AKAW2_50691A [Aspergillus luchuensis]OJZ82645.1 hypothetical protein ASPFODRAFT_210477 [Aspergillus luchuensis CBS 106.47]GAA91970.1 similar to An13g02730 [Aspergillus luchuensis IFO 4308]PYH30463.1 hypothet
MSTPAIQGLSSMGSSVGAYSRQQLATLRNRFLTTEKRRRRAQLISTSFSVHKPVWIAAGGAAYTTMGAVYLTLRYMRRLK